MCVCLQKFRSSFLASQDQVAGEVLMRRTTMQITEHINVDQLGSRSHMLGHPVPWDETKHADYLEKTSIILTERCF